MTIALLIAPSDVEHDAAVLVRTTRIGIPEAMGYNFEGTRLTMDALSPDGHLLAIVQGAGPRACWRALVNAIDAYFDTLA